MSYYFIPFNAAEKINYIDPTRQNLLNVYNEIGTNQIFGASEVAEIFDFSYAGARRVMAKLIEMDVLMVVKGKGKGKGKYRFLSESELKTDWFKATH